MHPGRKLADFAPPPSPQPPSQQQQQQAGQAGQAVATSPAGSQLDDGTDGGSATGAAAGAAAGSGEGTGEGEAQTPRGVAAKRPRREEVEGEGGEEVPLGSEGDAAAAERGNDGEGTAAGGDAAGVSGTPSSAAAVPPYDFRCFFLHRGRLELYDRIAQRIEEMVGTARHGMALVQAVVSVLLLAVDFAWDGGQAASDSTAAMQPLASLHGLWRSGLAWPWTGRGQWPQKRPKQSRRGGQQGGRGVSGCCLQHVPVRPCCATLLSDTRALLCQCRAVPCCAVQVFSGLLDEAWGLLQAGLRPGANMACKAIGYRQAMELLQVRAVLCHAAL